MKKIVVVLGLVLSVQFGKARDVEGYYTSSFDFNQPLANTKWINKMSTFGVRLGYHRLLKEKFSIGGEINVGTYKEYHPKTTFYNKGSALTTDYFNYIYSYGLVLSGCYYGSTNHLFNPFLGIGLGAASFGLCAPKSNSVK